MDKVIFHEVFIWRKASPVVPVFTGKHLSAVLCCLADYMQCLLCVCMLGPPWTTWMIPITFSSALHVHASNVLGFPGSCLFLFLILWDYYIIICFSLPFSPSKLSLYALLCFFKFMPIFTNCHCIHIWICSYMYIPKYNLLVCVK